ncbi:hypothetical protein [Vibrio metschnikovii]|uniref:hypothetical protein n=1 Tax=Vibrio metschnikovii TaxID=28172 RepID=UPI00165D4F26|nr:hypothetical protein [Vibrio metschnikovii]
MKISYLALTISLCSTSVYAWTPIPPDMIPISSKMPSGIDKCSVAICLEKDILIIPPKLYNEISGLVIPTEEDQYRWPYKYDTFYYQLMELRSYETERKIKLMLKEEFDSLDNSKKYIFAGILGFIADVITIKNSSSDKDKNSNTNNSTNNNSKDKDKDKNSNTNNSTNNNSKDNTNSSALDLHVKIHEHHNSDAPSTTTYTINKGDAGSTHYHFYGNNNNITIKIYNNNRTAPWAEIGSNHMIHSIHQDGNIWMNPWADRFIDKVHEQYNKQMEELFPVTDEYNMFGYIYHPINRSKNSRLSPILSGYDTATEVLGMTLEQLSVRHTVYLTDLIRDPLIGTGFSALPFSMIFTPQLIDVYSYPIDKEIFAKSLYLQNFSQIESIPNIDSLTLDRFLNDPFVSDYFRDLTLGDLSDKKILQSVEKDLNSLKFISNIIKDENIAKLPLIPEYYRNCRMDNFYNLICHN